MSGTKTCFIVTAIGDDGSDTRKRADRMYYNILEPVLRKYDYEIARADMIPRCNIIAQDIMCHLINDDLVIADLTENNPNVFYELAIRHVFQKPFIHISEKGQKLPFDVSQFRTIILKQLNDVYSELAAKKSIEEFIVDIEKNSGETASPIIDAINSSIGITKVNNSVGDHLYSLYIKGLQFLKKSKRVQSNDCLKHIIIKSLEDFATSIERVDDSFDISAIQYPLYLIHLQKSLSINTKAIAIIDREEYFWSQPSGVYIAESATSESARVFVFQTGDDFNKYHPTIVEHAKKYHVYITSYDSLAKIHPNYCRDFSILEFNGNKVLARYSENKEGKKVIQFKTDEAEIRRHEQIFEDIISTSKYIPRNIKPNDLQSSMYDIFQDGEQEMSLYVSPEDYDVHEEKHAYFLDMLNQMLKYYGDDRRSKGTEKVRILELGAGTGILTRKLLELPDVDIVAIEYDSNCYSILKEKVKAAIPLQSVFRESIHSCIIKSKALNKNVILLRDDSCLYNAAIGTFQYVFSSFAEHHIKPSDKLKYFKNVCEYIEPGGLFIVGDEFLREYRDQPDWEKALKEYHQHIIDCARAQNEMKLADLEALSCDAGLRRQGEFKISCRKYEEYLEKAGCRTFEKQKIGPLHLDNIGGIYVYRIPINE